MRGGGFGSMTEERRGLRVVHVTASFFEEAAGPSQSVPALCQWLAARGVAVRLHSLLPIPETDVAGVEVHGHRAWPFLPRLGICPAMRRAVLRESRWADVVHGHGLWMMPNVYVGAVGRFGASRAKLVISPRGMLAKEALQHSGARKRLFWKVIQGRVIRRADLLHATAPLELAAIRECSLRNPVAVIPNGVKIPSRKVDPPVSSSRRVLLYLGRLHPLKGLDALLGAWRRLEPVHPGWVLRIVGPDQSAYGREIKRRAAEVGLSRIEFPGAAYGSKKSDEMGSSELFVLPSRTENFGMAVAEALAHGLPVVVSRAAPWGEVESRGCGLSTWPDEDSLMRALAKMMAFGSDELRRRGDLGREWMRAEFSWPRVAAMMDETYRWLVTGGTPPLWVEVLP